MHSAGVCLSIRTQSEERRQAASAAPRFCGKGAAVREISFGRGPGGGNEFGNWLGMGGGGGGRKGDGGKGTGGEGRVTDFFAG